MKIRMITKALIGAMMLFGVGMSMPVESPVSDVVAPTPAYAASSSDLSLSKIISLLGNSNKTGWVTVPGITRKTNWKTKWEKGSFKSNGKTYKYRGTITATNQKCQVYCKNGVPQVTYKNFIPVPKVKWVSSGTFKKVFYAPSQSQIQSAIKTQLSKLKKLYS